MEVHLFSYRSARRDRRKVRAMVLLCVLAIVGSAYIALSESARAAPAGAHDGLFVRSMDATDAAYRAAPRLAQTIRLDIAGIVARGSVTQLFRNDSTHWVEARYRFPLPDDAAVDVLRVRVGDRIVEGVIQEREEARATYEAAREAGQTTALLDEDRPNLFTVSLANIGPGEVIAVELEYQSKVRREGDGFVYRMPLVVAPRYLPEVELSAIDHPALRAAIAKQLEDAARLGFPIDLSRRSNATALEIALDPGAPIASLESPSHELVVSRQEERYRIGLRLGSEPADRDMILRWRTERGAMPGATLFHERVGDTDYLLAMVQPPEDAAALSLDRPRDVTFVIDVSGSMHGPALDAARAALAEALSGLDPEDSFDVIAFSDRFFRLFGGSRAANDRNVQAALRFVNGLDSEGGTEMARPLRAALTDIPQPGALRQIVFLTDGLVGNEDELFRAIEANLGAARLFTVSLGSAPNGWFLRKASELGAGDTLKIADVGEARARMAAFYADIETPVAVDLDLRAGRGAVPETYPARLPDLYGARALIVPLAIRDWDGALTLSGELGGAPWSIELERRNARPAKGIAKLWAEGKVEAILDNMRRGALDEETGRLAVLDVALTHALATRYTSFVAVDREIRRPEGARLREGEVSNNLPAGMSAFAVGGLAGPAGAAGWEWSLIVGVVLVGGGLALVGLTREGKAS
jgi:Ca-activated chloride channel family protein